MPNYTRVYIPGGSYFYTVALLERRRHLLTENIGALRAAFGDVHGQRPFQIEAIVVLPDHLHCLWTLPPDDADYSTRWRLIKSRFSRSIDAGERLSNRRKSKQERGIWQRRFWEHAIRDQTDFDRHLDYIHYNPVKHGWAKAAREWPYSSFHRYAQLGFYSIDWAAPLEIQTWHRE